MAVIFGLQFWFSGQFNGPESIPLSRFASYVQNDEVERAEVDGNQINIQLKNGTVLSSVKGDDDLLAQLESLGVPEEVLATAPIYFRDSSSRDTFLSIALTVGPVLLLVWIFVRGFRQMQGGGNSIFSFGRSRARDLTAGNRPTVTFDDVAGVDEAKEEVKEIVQFLREPERFIQVGARIPKGVLMVGPPGTGKTLLARAIAGEAGVPFFHISGSEFVEMFVGVGASRVRDLFSKAKQHAPAIVFVDEIDAVGRQRGAGLGGGHDEREQTLNQILVEMDGFSNETNVIVIAATNRPDVLDPALLRPGRFDRKVIVDLPDLRGREAILKVHIRGKPISSKIDLSELARLSAGFSGADLENMVNEAAIFAARRGRSEVLPLDFQDAFDRIVMGPERKSRVMSEEDKELTAFHEAGHAVVSFNLTYTDPVQKVTIIPRGRAGGYVMSLPEDRLTMSREHFDDQIAFAFGGRAAEEVFFGRITTGAAADLQQATRIARAMIMQYGMSDSIGLRTFGEQQGSIFLGRDFTYGRDYSEDAAKAIDQEVTRILEENYARAKRLIEQNKNKLVELAHALMRVETLDRQEFDDLMNSQAPATRPVEVAVSNSRV
ncbi:MAG: ATP-dependent zinc metalloprotease FtsH [Chloroflexi bacterium]|nr:ATP-dependent zinc metalloprotease FtsH [Chloroflexota bacterium]MCI0578516.1 ATP-dependent zinc metalloprotease FtsH [Chloroflexota bacterium]